MTPSWSDEHGLGLTVAWFHMWALSKTMELNMNLVIHSTVCT